MFDFLRRPLEFLNSELITDPSRIGDNRGMRQNLKLDLSANPFDLRPAVKSIMAAQNWLLERLPPGQTLVINFGEDHTIPSHINLREAVILAMAAQREQNPDRTLAYGAELPHDFQDHLIRHGIDVPKERLTAPDPNDDLLIQSFKEFATVSESFAARMDFFQSCQRVNIPIAFNDVSKNEINEDSIINQEDAFTRNVIKRHYTALIGKDVYRKSKAYDDRDGIAISNFCIVENAWRHIERTGARIYIQDCGLGHNLGFKGHFPLEEALTATFTRAGLVVLNIIPRFEWFENFIPCNAKDALRHAVKISYLDDTEDTEMDYPTHRDKINAASGHILFTPTSSP